MSDMCTPCGNPEEKRKPCATVVVTKDEAAKMSIGSEVSLHMKGVVKAMNPDWDDKGSYRVEIEDPAVEVKESDKKEDSNYATMPREKLKEEVKKKTDEETK